MSSRLYIEDPWTLEYINDTKGFELQSFEPLCVLIEGPMYGDVFRLDSNHRKR